MAIQDDLGTVMKSLTATREWEKGRKKPFKITAKRKVLFSHHRGLEKSTHEQTLVFQLSRGVRICESTSRIRREGGGGHPLITPSPGSFPPCSRQLNYPGWTQINFAGNRNFWFARA